MISFFSQRQQLLIMVAFWFCTAQFLGPLIYLVLPLSVFYLRSRDCWPDLLIGFLFILILSDIDPMFFPLRSIKSAKYGMMIAMALVYLMETRRFAPQSTIFTTFLPFFVFSFVPIVNGSDPVNGIAKATSYALLYLVVPNYLLYNFRRYGWDFFRHLFIFLVLLIYSAYIYYLITPYYVRLMGRFRSWFGNPNGLGIFCFLLFMLYSVALYLKRDLFNFRLKVILYVAIVWLLIHAGSRTAVVASGMFWFFSRIFAVSPFIGFVVFLGFVAALEYAQQNLIGIVQTLGLQKFFRVETLEDGSGRYFAWAFAWEKITTEGYTLIGGGFGNDEYVMRHNYDYLRSHGHDGGVHNSYLTMWFNTGLVGIILYFRSFFLVFFKANKKAPIAFAIMFSVLFSVLYESWLTGSLNPYTIMLIFMMTMLTEDDIVLWREKEEEKRLAEEEGGDITTVETPVAPRLNLPAR